MKSEISQKQYLSLDSLYNRLLAKNASLVEENIDLHNQIVKMRVVIRSYAKTVDILKKGPKK